MFHDALRADRRHHFVIEGRRLIEPVRADGHVRDDAGVFVGHDPCPFV